MFRVGETTVDPSERAVHRAGVRAPLTALEADLLAHLWANAEQVVPREQLQCEVWRYSPGVVSRAVDQTVRRVRAKLGPDGGHIRPVYGSGYLLTGAEPARAGPFVGRDADLRRLNDALAAERVVWLVGPPGAGRTRLVEALPADPERVIVDDVDTFDPPPTGRWLVLPHLRPLRGAVVELGPLDEVHARGLVADDRIAAAVDHLPLGLALVSTRLARNPGLAATWGQGQGVHAALDRSIDRRRAALPPAADAALCALAAFEGPFAEDAAQEVVGGPVPLDDLRAASLVRQVGDRLAVWRSVRDRVRRAGVPAPAVDRHTARYAGLAWARFTEAHRGDELAQDALLPDLAELGAAAARDARAAIGWAWVAVVHGPLHDVEGVLTARLSEADGGWRHELHLARGQVRARQGADGRADLEVAAASADPDLRVRAWLARATLEFRRGLSQVAAYLGRAEDEIARHGVELRLPELWVRRAALAERTGDREGARIAIEQAAAHAERLGLYRSASRCWRQRSEQEYLAGRLDEAAACLQRSLTGASDVDLAYVAGSFAAIAYARGHLDEADALFARQLAVVERLGLSPVVALAALGQVALARGRPDRAEALLDEAERSAGSAGAEALVDQVRMYRGRAAHLRGDLAAARAAYERSAAVGPAGRLATYRGDLAWDEGDLQGALVAYGSALEECVHRGWVV
ncbi:MAG: winged helix-turn-helix domain-containing protein, partial [Myxococcota bacterium]